MMTTSNEARLGPHHEESFHSPTRTSDEGELSPPLNNTSSTSLLAQALGVPSLNHPVDSSHRFSSSIYNDETVATSHEAAPTTMIHHTFSPVSRTEATPKSANGTVAAALATPWIVPPFPDMTTGEEDVMMPLHSDFTIPTSNAFYNNKQVDFSMAPPDELPPSNEGSGRRSVFGNSVGQRYPVPVLAKGQSPVVYPPESPVQVMYKATEQVPVSPLTPARTSSMTLEQDDEDEESREILLGHPPRFLHRQTFHETVHAQSLLLGLAFMAIWSPNNAMAPNLTQMAEFFGMSQAERDLYLGSYCALALGVFSLPLSALLGFMTDFYARKHLFVCCVIGGALASAWTGWSKTFASLFWARLISGGCMSGSVPVAFSLLGDLFSTEERNAASSGLTAMMGLGILLGQVYAGTLGPGKSWQFPFFASSILSLTTALLVILWVREPVRGAKEKALQGLLTSGNKYERQLTLAGFLDAMQKNRSNSLLLWQGFFTSLPWGIVFVFLNDYLSQEKGFSVPDATFVVMLFGVGCAIGGITGGYIGQMCQKHNRHLLPLFMALETVCGILPFLGLLNSDFPNKHGFKAMGFSILGGCIASLPSVSVRPCILNVNPPETRGAALTAANLLVTLGRGIGPVFITLMGSIFGMSRQSSFNITLSFFWTISAILLLFLVKTLPEDQDAMEEGLVRYAEELARNKAGFDHIQDRSDLLVDHDRDTSNPLLEDEMCIKERSMYNDTESIVSIEDYRTSFDGEAAKRSIDFMRQGFKELTDEMVTLGNGCRPCDSATGQSEQQDREDDAALEEILPQEEMQRRQILWKKQREQQQRRPRELEDINEKEEGGPHKTETTPLLGLRNDS
jgi:MFS family permease